MPESYADTFSLNRLQQLPNQRWINLWLEIRLAWDYFTSSKPWKCWKHCNQLKKLKPQASSGLGTAWPDNGQQQQQSNNQEINPFFWIHQNNVWEWEWTLEKSEILRQGDVEGWILRPMPQRVVWADAWQSAKQVEHSEADILNQFVEKQPSFL